MPRRSGTPDSDISGPEFEGDDPWLDDEETDADDDTPLLENPHDGLEWEEGDEDDDDEDC
jgi:hypothetical protein